MQNGEKVCCILYMGTEVSLKRLSGRQLLSSELTESLSDLSDRNLKGIPVKIHRTFKQEALSDRCNHVTHD